MKEMIIFAGVNGSGKSTLYRGFNNNDIIYLNADEIALTLGDQHDSLVQFKAGKLLIEKLNTVLSERKSFIIETTLSGTSLFSYIKKAKQENYKITLYYIMSDIKTSKERIAYRVSQGGHNIPIDVIERRYNKSFNNLYDNYHLFDEIYFYDNLNQYHKLIGYYNNKLEILDNASKWSSILKNYIK